MKIQVTIKNVYGKETVYPVDQNGKTFCELLGQRSFTLRDIKLIKQLGYTVEVVSDKPKEL